MMGINIETDLIIKEIVVEGESISKAVLLAAQLHSHDNIMTNHIVVRIKHADKEYSIKVGELKTLCRDSNQGDS